MDYDEFVTIVAQAIGTQVPGTEVTGTEVTGTETGTAGRADAERAIQATLATLGERLGRDECRHLVAQLPPEVGGWLFSAGGARHFDAVEFVDRVGQREQAAEREQAGRREQTAQHEQVDPATAERHARAVFIALSRGLPDDAYAHLRTRLSRDYAPLLAKGPYAGAVPLGEFLTGVARRAGVDVETARQATEAVLETLGERIASGEVEDLISQLPVPLHPALRRGVARSDARTIRMPVDEFVDRVAQRAGAPVGRAREYVRAVFATLRETVKTEFFDVTDQLPDGYWDLAAGR
jgi:uncharacterized protein (DUF2267 family)